MKNKDLTIIVAGECGSGKSSLIYLLKKFLREQEFEVEQEVNIDHSTESDFDMVVSQKFDSVINNIKETRKIKLKELQCSRQILK